MLHGQWKEFLHMARLCSIASLFSKKIITFLFDVFACVHVEVRNNF